MVRKFVLLCTFLSFIVTSLPLSAQDPLMTNKTRSDSLSWGALSDPDLKKTASSMVMWGFIFTAAIAILSLVIQPSTSTTSTTTSS